MTEEENLNEQTEQDEEFLVNSAMAFTDDGEDVEIDMGDEDPIEQKEDSDSDGDEQPEEEDGLKVGYRRGGGRLVGKHSLKHDSIFKGREHSTPIEETYFNEDVVQSFKVDTASDLVEEIQDQEEHDRLNRLKELVYQAMLNEPTVDISAPRRKPSKVDFNRYFEDAARSMPNGMFSDAEVFVELSSYFSDNLYSMFKLLDKERSEKIIKGLVEKYNMPMLDELDFQ